MQSFRINQKKKTQGEVDLSTKSKVTMQIKKIYKMRNSSLHKPK